MPSVTSNVQVIRSAERYHADHGWLDTRWHFSFADYNDPDNVHFGPLRVFNDDVVKGGGGFDMHPHRDMEIITYVISGKLEHRDHLGNRGVVHPGEVQVMSAGKGIVHAEFNASQTEPVRLLQLWVLPRHTGLKPRWEQRQFTPDQRAGKLLPVVTPAESDGTAGAGGTGGETLRIDQDATIYVSSLKAGQTVEHRAPAPGRKAYLFVIDGAVTLDGGVALSAGDQARVDLGDDATLALRADKDAELILLDLPAEP
jgi:redox-sensitive bicupin YhaK (pirin superfamily)